MRSLRVSWLWSRWYLVMITKMVHSLIGLQVRVVHDFVDPLLLCPHEVPVVAVGFLPQASFACLFRPMSTSRMQLRKEVLNLMFELE